MIKRTFDLLTNLEQHFSQKFHLAAKQNNTWRKYDVNEYRNEVDLFSYGLLALGIQKNDKIATVSNNRPEWNFVDFGIEQTGAVHVPIYPTISDADYRHILSHSEAKLIIVSSIELYERIAPLQEEIETLEAIYTFDQIDGIKHWSEIQAIGKLQKNELTETLKQAKDAVHEDDMVSIIYTSGTTGLPKGVMLSHKNFLSNVEAAMVLHPLEYGHTALSFLPLCHVLERMLNYLYQYKGVSIYYAETVDKIVDNLQEIRPNGFVTVPRLLEKIFDRIVEKGAALTGIKRKLFFWALELGLKYEFNGANGWLYEKQLKVADKLIFSKWRAALGGEVIVIIVGGAALQARLARVFNAAGILVNEGYGLTETSPVIAVNQIHWPYKRFGTVGPVLGNVEVKIADDGEILMKGPSLMLGYYKDNEKTATVIDKDGWFHTGDIGELSDYNLLRITDRKKEMFKLSGGKYVAPQVVENIMKESIFMEQLIVLGEGKKYTAALVSPNFEFLFEWAKKSKIGYRDKRELIENKKVIARFQQEINEKNDRLGKVEQIKQFQLVTESWTPESGELSPTQKLKRKFVKQKYASLIEGFWN